MIDNILLVVILLIIIFIIVQKTEPMKDHNFEYLNSKASTFLKNDTYNSKELIEITDLLKCKKVINFDYGSNYNFIINNNISIYQDILDPLQNTIEVDNTNYNLTSVRWKISKLSYNQKPVGLEFHVVHQNYDSIYKITVVIPLDLVNNNIEGFKNTFYKKMTKDFNLYTDTIIEDYEKDHFNNPLYFQKAIKFEAIIQSLKNIYNLNRVYKNTKYSLSKLIPSEVLIPDYECCKDTIGQKISFNFCDLQQILQNNNQKYFQLEDRDGNIYLITDPVPFDERLGLYIMNKIKHDENIIYMKQKKI